MGAIRSCLSTWAGRPLRSASSTRRSRRPRVPALESGKDLQPRTLIAFGGAAPLHAARLAEKLGISRVLVPVNAGVGSAIGLLRAPIAYEVVRGQLMRLGSFEPGLANRLLAGMSAEAEAIVRRAAPAVYFVQQISVFMS